MAGHPQAHAHQKKRTADTPQNPPTVLKPASDDDEEVKLGRSNTQMIEVTDGLKAGDVVFVPANELHQFRNTGRGVLAFLCLIPHPMRGAQDACAVACGCE